MPDFFIDVSRLGYQRPGFFEAVGTIISGAALFAAVLLGLYLAYTLVVLLVGGSHVSLVRWVGTAVGVVFAFASGFAFAHTLPVAKDPNQQFPTVTDVSHLVEAKAGATARGNELEQALNDASSTNAFRVTFHRTADDTDYQCQVSTTYGIHSTMQAVIVHDCVKQV